MLKNCDVYFITSIKQPEGIVYRLQDMGVFPNDVISALESCFSFAPGFVSFRYAGEVTFTGETSVDFREQYLASADETYVSDNLWRLYLASFPVGGVAYAFHGFYHAIVGAVEIVEIGDWNVRPLDKIKRMICHEAGHLAGLLGVEYHEVEYGVMAYAKEEYKGYPVPLFFCTDSQRGISDINGLNLLIPNPKLVLSECFLFPESPQVTEDVVYPIRLVFSNDGDEGTCLLGVFMRESRLDPGKGTDPMWVELHKAILGTYEKVTIDLSVALNQLRSLVGLDDKYAPTYYIDWTCYRDATYLSWSDSIHQVSKTTVLPPEPPPPEERMLADEYLYGILGQINAEVMPEFPGDTNLVQVELWYNLVIQGSPACLWLQEYQDIFYLIVIFLDENPPVETNAIMFNSGEARTQLDPAGYISRTVGNDSLAALPYIGVLANLSGRVTDAQTGDPLPGVVVSINTLVISTGADGRYAFVGLEPGSYTIRFEKAGYATLEQAISLVEGDNVFDVALPTEEEEAEDLRRRWPRTPILIGAACIAALVGVYVVTRSREKVA